MLKPIVRQYVSGDRRRYKADDGTNLDLTYIQDNIIAMSFPASGFIETVWRNSIHTVGAFLVKNHGDNFMVFNVSERTYNGKKMKKQMIYIPFADHHPPPLVQFFETVTMIDAWLKSSPEHVAIIHCVGGKGRTGTIISALMFYDCTFATAEESADHFARSRSMLGRGVTQPSQKRYLGYFERFLTGEMLNFCPVMIKKFILVGLISERYTIEIYDSPWDGNLRFQFTLDYDNSVGPCIFLIDLQAYGDIYIKCKAGRSTVFRSCLHTYFINEDNIVFVRDEIDGLDTNFVAEKIQLAMTFAQIPTARPRQPNTIFVKALKEFKVRRQMSPFGAIPDKILPTNNTLANSSGRSRAGEVFPSHAPPPLPPPPPTGFSAPKIVKGGVPAPAPAPAKQPEWDKRATTDPSTRAFSMYQSPSKRQRFPTMKFESLMEEIEKYDDTNENPTVEVVERAVPARGVIGVGRLQREDTGRGGAIIGGRGADGVRQEVGSMGRGRYETLMRRIERYSLHGIQGQGQDAEDDDDEEEDEVIPGVRAEGEETTTESSDDSLEEYERVTQEQSNNAYGAKYYEVEIVPTDSANIVEAAYFNPEVIFNTNRGHNNFIDIQVDIDTNNTNNTNTNNANNYDYSLDVNNDICDVGVFSLADPVGYESQRYNDNVAYNDGYSKNSEHNYDNQYNNAGNNQHNNNQFNNQYNNNQFNNNQYNNQYNNQNNNKNNSYNQPNQYNNSNTYNNSFNDNQYANTNSNFNNQPNNQHNNQHNNQPNNQHNNQYNNQYNNQPNNQHNNQPNNQHNNPNVYNSYSDNQKSNTNSNFNNQPNTSYNTEYNLAPLTVNVQSSGGEVFPFPSLPTVPYIPESTPTDDKYEELRKKQQKLQELQLKLQQLQAKKPTVVTEVTEPSVAFGTEQTQDISPKPPRISPEKNQSGGIVRSLPSSPPSPTPPVSQRAPHLMRRSTTTQGDNTILPARSPRAKAATLDIADASLSRQHLPPHLAQRQVNQPLPPLPPHLAHRQAPTQQTQQTQQTQPQQNQQTQQTQQTQASGSGLSRAPIKRQLSQPETRSQIQSPGMQQRTQAQKQSSQPEQRQNQQPARSQTSSGDPPTLTRQSAVSSVPSWATRQPQNQTNQIRPTQSAPQWQGAQQANQPDSPQAPRSAFARPPSPTFDVVDSYDHPYTQVSPNSARSLTRSPTLPASSQQIQQDEDGEKRIWPPRKPVLLVPSGPK